MTLLNLGRICLFLASISILSACGGGGGGGGGEPETTPVDGGDTSGTAPEVIGPNLQHSYSNEALSLDRESGQLLGQMILTDLLQADEFMWEAHTFHNFDTGTGLPDLKNYSEGSVTEPCAEGGTLTATVNSTDIKITASYNNCTEGGITANGTITLQFYDLNYEANTYWAIYQFNGYTEKSGNETVGYLDGYLLYSQTIADLSISVFESHLETIQPLTQTPYISKLYFSAASSSNDHAQFYNLSGSIQTAQGIATLSLTDHKMLNRYYDEEDIGTRPEPTTSIYIDAADNEFTISSEFQHTLASIYLRDSNSYFSRYTQSVEKNESLLTGMASDSNIEQGAGGQEYTSPIDEPAYIHPGYFLSTNALTFIDFNLVQDYPINNRADISLDTLLKVSGNPDFYKIEVTSSDENTSGGESLLEVYLSTLSDLDSDGIPDHQDDDDDNDGYYDDRDVFPRNSEEWLDTDLDGIGNNSDPDIDGDGYTNGDDLYPEEVMCANEYETVNGGCVFYSISPNDVQAADNTGMIYIIDKNNYQILRWNSNTGRLIAPIPLEYSQVPDLLVYSEAQDRLYFLEEAYRSSISYIENPSTSETIQTFIDEEVLGTDIFLQAMDNVLFVANGNGTGSDDWAITIYGSDKTVIDNYKVSHGNGPENPIWLESNHSLITGYGNTPETTRVSRTDFSHDFTEHEFIRTTIDQGDHDLLPFYISDTEIFFLEGQKMTIDTMEITDPISFNFKKFLFANKDEFIIVEERYDGDYAVTYNHNNESLAELKGDFDSFWKGISSGDNTVIVHNPDDYSLRLTVIDN